MKKRISSLVLLYFSSLLVHYAKINVLFYVIFILFLFISILFFLKNRKEKLRLNKYFYLIMIYIIQSIYITVININNLDYQNVIKLFMYYLYFFIIFMFIKNNKDTATYNFYRGVRNIGNFLIIINIIEIINRKSLFYSFLKGNSVNWQIAHFGTSEFRTFSIFAHPISFAIFLTCLFWINMYMPLKNRVMHKIFLFLILANIYFTQSRSIWIALIITILFYFVINMKDSINKFKYKLYKINIRNINLIIMYSICMIILLIIFDDNIKNIITNIYDRFITITDNSYNDYSRIQRLQSITNIMNSIFSSGVLNSIAGNGYGAVNIFMKNNTTILNLDAPDCGIASISYDFGLLGIIFYIIINVYPVIRLYKNYNKNNIIKNISVFIIIVTFIASFSVDTYGWPSIIFIQFFAMAIFSNNDIDKNRT